MGGSKKMQQVRSIANRPQGGGNKKQGLPPSIGRAGWFSNFIRTNAGGYFRSIPGPAAAICPEKILTGDQTITNLAALQTLSGVTKIVGNLIIENSLNITNLSNLNCLNNITGGLYINNNDILANIDGLAKLTSVGAHLDIDNNALLANINGLAKLTSIGRDLFIVNNANLLNIDGFANLTSVGEKLIIENNANLLNIDGFANLTSIGGYLYILNNANLNNIDGFAKLTTIGSHLILTNLPDLVNADGLWNVVSVGEDFEVISTGLTNAKFGSLVTNLTTIGGNITVKGNTPLADVGAPAALIKWGVAGGGRTAMDGTNGEDFSVAARGVINALPGSTIIDLAALVIAVDLWISDNVAALSTYGEINTWDTSLVTDMTELFKNKTTFNDDISNWDTSLVTNMTDMFRGATNFNKDIGNWDVSNVTIMLNMFRGATNFNNGESSSIGNWRTLNVINMQGVFYGAEGFNQNIGDWDTEKVGVNDVNPLDSFREMFRNATAFNNGESSSIGTWKTQNAKNMRGMFEGAAAFDQDISDWNTGEVQSMKNMFEGAAAFDQNIRTSGVKWNTAKVTRMDDMFDGATKFDQDIKNWDVDLVTDFDGMFRAATAMIAAYSGDSDFGTAPNYTPVAAFFDQ